jgi:hypothetical protein
MSEAEEVQGIEGEGKKVGQMKSTGEVVTATFDASTSPKPFQGEEELRKYRDDVRTLDSMQYEDTMQFQQQYGYVPRVGDPDVPEGAKKRGLSAEDIAKVYGGKASLELINKEEGLYRVVDRETGGQS